MEQRSSCVRFFRGHEGLPRGRICKALTMPSSSTPAAICQIDMVVQMLNAIKRGRWFGTAGSCLSPEYPCDHEPDKGLLSLSVEANASSALQFTVATSSSTNARTPVTRPLA
jgi:hypothetical protein